VHISLFPYVNSDTQPFIHVILNINLANIAYVFRVFENQTRNTIKKEMPNINEKQIIKEIDSRWASLSKKEIKSFEQMAKSEKPRPQSKFSNILPL
jgi:hypothetical protein